MVVVRRSLCVLMLALAACDRAQPPATDTLAAKQAAAAESLSALSPTRNWDRGAGPILLIVAETPARAMVIVPDSVTGATTLANLPKPASVTLIGRGGTVQTAELPEITE